ncbi:MAG TPA: FtsX-like permease family protein [Methylococcaceae bacterium]|nr:FtsX-like permease family protein [Methylococcaceae bacterium]
MNRVNLGLRLLFRDGRSGELNLLVIALIIAVTSSTAVSLFADRLHHSMSTQAAEFLAADLVITSPGLIPPQWLSKAQSLHLNTARTAEFSTVLIENDELLLAGTKAVSSQYPLRGYLKTVTADYSTETIRHQGPEQGEVWVDKRILSALKMALGNDLQVGEKTLRITRLISYEPDKRGDLYSFSPRVMMNDTDLAATQVLKPGSHVHYFFQFSGPATAIKQFNHWVKPQLNASQRIMDIHQDRPQLGNALSRAERYLGLSSIVVILIAGVAIAMSTRRYSERHFDTTALLRCLGCKQHEIISLYLLQFIILGLVASLIGVGLGWLAQDILFHLLRDLLPAEVPTPSLMAVILGFVTGQAILLGFALPPLLRLKKVSPLRVLRRDLEPLPSSAWLVYSLTLSLVSILIWQYTQDFKMTATIIGGGVIAVIISGFSIYALLLQSKKALPFLGLAGRLGLQSILRSPQSSVSQILAFSITLLAMILIFTVRTDVLDDWQKQLPDNAPNHFVLNIFPQQANAFKQQLQQLNITDAQFYPVVRGRLVKINDIAVQQIVSKDSQGERATHRDLSLTWAERLPKDNKTIAGTWSSEQKGQLSIEQKLANSLHVSLGDKLTFTIGSQQVQASISHIRSVQWDSMKPNFYMLFSPGTLENYPSTLITSFYLTDTNKNYLNILVKKFPSITILEVDLIIKQFKIILTQLTAAINYLLYFSLLAGFTVLFATVYSTLDHRIYESTLMRTFGASQRLLTTSHLIEFSLIGLLSGLIAVFMSELIIYTLYTLVLHLDYHISNLLWWFVPLLSSLCITAAGTFAVRDVVNKSPMQVLREL